MFNGKEVTATNHVSEPFSVPYPSLLAKFEALRAGMIPAALLGKHRNSLEITLHSGDPVSLVFLDLDCHLHSF